MGALFVLIGSSKLAGPVRHLEPAGHLFWPRRHAHLPEQEAVHAEQNGIGERSGRTCKHDFNPNFRARSRHGRDSGGGRKGRSDPRYLHGERRHSVEARRSQAPWTADVRGVGESKRGRLEILHKFPAGMDSGWHWHTAAYQGVVIQGKFTHTFKGAAPQTGGPGSVWSQPPREVQEGTSEEGGDTPARRVTTG